MNMHLTPSAGLPGPSLPVRVEPLKLPDVRPSPAPAREPSAPPAPARDPEEVPA